MKKTNITVTDASRNFAECLNRVHYQDTTFILLKNGKPFARLEPQKEKVCTGRELAEVLSHLELPENEAQEWRRDLRNARRRLKAPVNKWR